jgi:hypothetical protein
VLANAGLDVAVAGNRADDPIQGNDDGPMSLVEIWPVVGISVRTPSVVLSVPDQASTAAYPT